MPTGVHTQKNVPKEQLKIVVAGFEAQGAKVQTKEQPDGRYTVTATFPEE